MASVSNNYGVSSVSEVVKRLIAFNVSNDVSEYAGWTHTASVAKRDIDSFFNSVPRWLVKRAGEWCLATFIFTYGRRQLVIMVPRKGNPRTRHGMRVMNRAFKGHTRNLNGSDNGSFRRVCVCVGVYI